MTRQPVYTYTILILSVLVCASMLPHQASAATETTIPCKFADTDTHSTFDLTSARMELEHGYALRDKYDKDRKYTYFFNVCGLVTPPNKEKCNKDMGPGPAFQLDGPLMKADGCYRLGSSEIQNDAEFELINKRNPARGVKLTYKNGELCEALQKNRSLTINFNCVSGTEEAITRVTESECHYTLDINSQAGCPLECPLSRNSICGGVGVCSYDRDLRAPRCFCNSGRYGSDCSLTTAPVLETQVGCDTMCIVLSVVISFLVLLMCGAGLMLWRVHKLAKLNIKFERAVDDGPDDIQTFPPLALN